MSQKADPFTDMAVRVEACPEREFGGALVLVAPDGKKVEFMLTNPAAAQTSAVVAFWGFIKSSIDDAFNEMTTQPQGMGGMRFPPR